MPDPLEDISLDGGWLCLDFTNTVAARVPETGRDYLLTWADFVLWVHRTQLLPDAEFQVWQQLPPGEIAEVKALREAIYDLFAHLAQKGIVHPAHLDTLNSFLHEVYAHTRLYIADPGICRGVSDEFHTDKPLWIIALSAESLLLNERLSRVKACDNCGWLFLDTSKNGTRRWCNMSTCGSQTKAKAWYHRKKDAKNLRH